MLDVVFGFIGRVRFLMWDEWKVIEMCDLDEPCSGKGIGPCDLNLVDARGIIPRTEAGYRLSHSWTSPRKAPSERIDRKNRGALEREIGDEARSQTLERRQEELC